MAGSELDLRCIHPDLAVRWSVTVSRLSGTDQLLYDRWAPATTLRFALVTTDRRHGSRLVDGAYRRAWSVASSVMDRLRARAIESCCSTQNMIGDFDKTASGD